MSLTRAYGENLLIELQNHSEHGGSLWSNALDTSRSERRLRAAVLEPEPTAITLRSLQPVHTASTAPMAAPVAVTVRTALRMLCRDQPSTEVRGSMFTILISSRGLSCRSTCQPSNDEQRYSGGSSKPHSEQATGGERVLQCPCRDAVQRQAGAATLSSSQTSPEPGACHDVPTASSPTFAFSMLSTTSVPLTTRPNTVCLPSSHGVGTVVMKNCAAAENAFIAPLHAFPGTGAFVYRDRCPVAAEGNHQKENGGLHAAGGTSHQGRERGGGSGPRMSQRKRCQGVIPLQFRPRTWLPLVPGPALAMLRVKGRSWRRSRVISSPNSPPHMDCPPVPSPGVGRTV